MLKVEIIKKFVKAIITDPSHPNLKFIWRGGFVVDIFENGEELYDDLDLDPFIAPTLKGAKQAVKQFLKHKEKL